MNAIVFGGVDWWYHNRSHIDPQLTRRFVKHGNTLYINSIVYTRIFIKDNDKLISKILRKMASILTGLKMSSEGFWVYSPFSIPVHHRPIAKKINNFSIYCQIRRIQSKLKITDPIIIVANPVAVDIAFKLHGTKIAYQRTDRFEEAIGVDRDTILECDRKLKENADITYFVNTRLYNEEAHQCKKAIFLDHGVDFDFFANAEHNKYKPTDIANIKHPIIGYFGAIDEHSVDIPLLINAAKALPEMSFVFIGSGGEAYPNLFTLPNVYYLGQKDYTEIPHYGKCFDVALLPWTDNRWTNASNPIKIKEYLALGKPIVSTPFFSEVDRYLDVAYIARSGKEFIDQILKALAEDNVNKRIKRQEKVKVDTWDSKAEYLINEILNS